MRLPRNFHQFFTQKSSLQLENLQHATSTTPPKIHHQCRQFDRIWISIDIVCAQWNNDVAKYIKWYLHRIAPLNANWTFSRLLLAPVMVVKSLELAHNLLLLCFEFPISTTLNLNQWPIVSSTCVQRSANDLENPPDFTRKIQWISHCFLFIVSTFAAESTEWDRV